MENKIYFTVQDIKKISLGHRMYTNEVLNVTFYNEDEIEKAIKNYKKRKANTIMMTRVTYLDKAPYVKEESDFGERHFIDMYDEEYDGTIKECIDFYEFDVRYYI